MINGAILYEIYNDVTNKRYIGVTSMTLKQRWAVHLYRFRNGKQPNKLQEDFNKFGENSFFIKELNKGSLEKMFLLEKRLTEITVKEGYNSIIGGNDIEEKIAASSIKTEKMKNDTEYKKGICLKIGNGNFGKKLSSDTKNKISIANSGKKRSIDVIEKMSLRYKGSNNPNAGNFRIYLNVQTGIYYTSPELHSLLETNKSGLRWLLKINDPIVSSFIKV